MEHAAEQAAEHAASSGSALLDPHLGTIIWTIVTFLVVLVILRWKVWTPLLAALDERERKIADALAAAQLAHEEAEETLKRHHQTLADAEAEASKLVSDARHTAERLHEEILTRARVEADHLTAQARRSIESERRQAVASLRREVAGLAVQAAGAILDANLDNERNRRLADEAIAHIPLGSGAPAEPGPDSGEA